MVGVKDFSDAETQGKKYTGAPGDFAPEMQKKSPGKKIAIDCNVKACSMLQS